MAGHGLSVINGRKYGKWAPRAANARRADEIGLVRTSAHRDVPRPQESRCRRPTRSRRKISRPVTESVR